MARNRREQRLGRRAAAWRRRGVELAEQIAQRPEQHAGKEPMRVGYVNVNGLDERTWQSLLALLVPGKLDLIFVAETWYVGYDKYITSPATVAFTSKPTARTGSRHTGGICLIASNKARLGLSVCPVVTTAAIVLEMGSATVAGVYFPPAMSAADLNETLTLVAGADVVLGDVNVRYNSITGAGAPADRAQALEDWTRLTAKRRLHDICTETPFEGTELALGLTLDHCFVRRAHVGNPLCLLSCSSLGVTTDHAYMLVLGMYTTSRPVVVVDAELPRFRNGRLDDAKVADRFRDEWVRVTGRGQQATLGRRVDVLNDYLVDTCQRTCRKVLGEVPKTKASPSSSTTAAATQSYHEMVRGIFRLDEVNGPLFSGDPDQTGLEEAAGVLGERYCAPVVCPPIPADWPFEDGEPLEPFTVEETRKAIVDQDASKACGSDGIHTRALKALVETSLVTGLTELFNACLEDQTTPLAWNSIDIHLIVKDRTRPKTIANARPISLICMFRKIFECCLLRRMVAMPSMGLHPAQAGFRADYSTLTLAALVHIALSQRLCKGVVFLDFRAAFDMVDHKLLRDTLYKRGCPRALVYLLDALGTGNRSRVLGNGGASGWFQRSRGVLQGSPLSPFLWNLIADDLLHDLNRDRDAAQLPACVFFADDGALLYETTAAISPMLRRVERWSERNGIEVNVGKCGHVTTTFREEVVMLAGEVVPWKEEYRYLGFPMTGEGINFEVHLERRLESAINRAAFMACYSGSWGVANRLRAYKQYLAPVIEYGAPLVWAWAGKDALGWRMANRGWKRLIAWIVRGTHAWRLSQNILGLSTLEDRFEGLHMGFLFRLQYTDRVNPLHGLLFRPPAGGAYRRALRENRLLGTWRLAVRGALTEKKRERFLSAHLCAKLSNGATKTHLTSLVRWESRVRTGSTYGDRVLTAPVKMQDEFFKYRRGVWCWRYRHRCELVDRGFRRGDEECPCQRRFARLSRKEILKRDTDFADMPTRGLVTTVDWLLCEGQWLRAFQILQRVKSTMTLVHEEGRCGLSDGEESVASMSD